MAKKKKRRARKPTLAIGVVGPIAYTAVWAYQSHENPADKLKHYINSYIPYTDPLEMDQPFKRLKYGLFPLLLGFGLHKLAQILGINRALASSGVPYIRL